MVPFLLRFVSAFRRNFKTLKKLGSGSFGEVLLVQRRSTKRLYVSKTVKTKRISRFAEDGLSLVPMEIANLMKLEHSNIVELHGYMETEKTWILVMEHSPNYCDVRRFVRHYGALSENLAKHVYIQVYNAVKYCFDMGIHHRDIKDQNILINKKTAHVKLIDFGSSCRGSLQEPYESASGTLLYLPPDYFLDKTYLPLDAAVWSMGCLLFVMMTAKNPFRSVSQILTRDIALEIPDTVSYEGSFFIIHCLQKDKSERLNFHDVPLHLWVLTFPGFDQ